MQSENIKLEYCPTEKMMADFFSKPLQGALFRKLCDVVLGYIHIQSLHQVNEESPVEERVGKDENSNSYTGEIATNDSPTVDSVRKNQMTWTDIIKGTNKDIEGEKRNVKPLTPLR